MWSFLISAVVATTIVSGTSPLGGVEVQVFNGKVISVSVAERTLTFSDPAGQIMRTLAIPEGSKVTLNGKAAELMELMAGDLVTLTIDGQKIQRVVAIRSIKVSKMARTAGGEPAVDGVAPCSLAW